MLVPVIEEFLADWKVKAREFYMETFEAFRAEMSARYPVTADSLALVTKNSWSKERRYSDEKIAEIMADSDEHWPGGLFRSNLEAEIHHARFSAFKERIGKGVTAMCQSMHVESRSRSGSAEAYLEKMLDREVDRKRAALVAQVEKKAGAIVDASGLHIGADGGINGMVTGEIKTVTVQTIYAGGYNIQCLHYRVLVK